MIGLNRSKKIVCVKVPLSRNMGYVFCNIISVRLFFFLHLIITTCTSFEQLKDQNTLTCHRYFYSHCCHCVFFLMQREKERERIKM